ncbi:Uncharacterised protein [Salmonella enterica subsp. enterica]|nr:Uncharacterised protein [Salmonella enterica subsp. enterica]
MSVIAWFLWRRWQFKNWIGNHYYPKLIGNTLSVNFARCREYPIIHRDIVRIVNANRDDKDSRGSIRSSL